MGSRHALLMLCFILASSGASFAQGGQTVTGTVREEGSNIPILAATLEIASPGSSTSAPVVSGIQGEFMFRDIPDGEYLITAKKDGYVSASATVTVMRTGATSVTILLRRKGPSSVEPGAPISAHQLQVPEKARTAYEKGRKLLEDENKPVDAIPEFERAIKLFPSYYEAYTELGIANYHLGKVPEAEASLKQSIALSAGKFDRALYVLADLYNSERKYQEAEPLARQAVALDSSNWNGHFELARALVGLKQTAEAESSAQRARELAPQNPSVYLVLANVHVLQQNYRAAVQDFDGYLKLAPNGQSSDAVRRTRDKLEKQAQAQPNANPPSSPQPAQQP